MNKLASQFNLSPATMAGLANVVGAPPPQPDQDSPEAWQAAMANAGASTEEQDIAARANAAPNVVAATSPTNIPGWTPERDVQGRAEAARDAELAGANPQGPAGSDGFPTYRDLSQPQPGIAPAAAGVGGGYVAPHWQNNTRSGKVERGIAPEMLEGGQQHRDQAAGSALLAADARYRAAQLETDAEAKLAEADAVARERANAVRNRIAQQRAAYVDQEKGKFEQLAAAASKDVDPNDYWKQRGGTGAEIFAAIGIALGQFGAALTGGRNAALDIINAGIDRNIDAQKANISKARSAYDLRSNLYARNLEAIGDPERAAAATRAQYLDQVKSMLGQQYASARGAKDEAAYHDMLAAVEKERAASSDKFAELSHDKITDEMTAKYVAGGPTGGAGQKGKEPLYVPTMGGYARDPETARALNNKGAARMSMNENLRKIYANLEKAKHMSSVGDYRALQEIDLDNEALTNDILQTSNVMKGQGAMSDGDKAVTQAARRLQGLKAQFTTDATIDREKERVKRSALQQMQDHRMDAEAHGIQMGTEEYRQGLHGPESVAKLAGRNKVLTKRTEDFGDVRMAPKGKAEE